MLKALAVRTNGTYEIKEYEAPLHKALGQTVGGWIEIVTPAVSIVSGLIDNHHRFVCNEEGALIPLPHNVFGTMLYGNIIHGDIVMCKVGITQGGDIDIVSLTDDEIARYIKILEAIK